MGVLYSYLEAFCWWPEGVERSGGKFTILMHCSREKNIIQLRWSQPLYIRGGWWKSPFVATVISWSTMYQDHQNWDPPFLSHLHGDGPASIFISFQLDGPFHISFGMIKSVTLSRRVLLVIHTVVTILCFVLAYFFFRPKSTNWKIAIRMKS